MLGLVSGMLVSVFPVVGIKKSWDPIVADQGQLAFFMAFIITMTFSGAIIFQRWCAQASRCPPSRRQITRSLLTICGALLFFLLYFAANALSQRLSIGLIVGESTNVSGIKLAGLSCAFTGMIFQIAALLRWPAIFVHLRHPCFFATLVFLIGVPLQFGSWFALFALPGIFVVMKWMISFSPQDNPADSPAAPDSSADADRPAAADSPADDAQVSSDQPAPGREPVWQLIPYIY